MENQVAVEERLQSLGMKAASEKIVKLRGMKRKLAVAYEHFRFVSPEKIAKFQEKLSLESRGQKYLAFQSLESYPGVPPTNVLDDIERAIGLRCFDKFEVASIQAVPDPIVFGIIDGCPDKFFVSQWDDDVKISDILKDNEG